MSLSRRSAPRTPCSGPKLLAAGDGLGPEERRDARLDRVRPGRKHGPERPAVGSLQAEAARPAAGDADVARDRGEHAARPDDLLAVGAPLHAVALVEHAGLARGVLAGDARDRVARHAGDAFGPGGRLWRRRRACRGCSPCSSPRLRRPGRHLGGVEADAVRPHELRVVQALRDHHVGHRRHHRGVGARPDRESTRRPAPRRSASCAGRCRRCARRGRARPARKYSVFVPSRISLGFQPHIRMYFAFTQSWRWLPVTFVP